MRDFIDFIKYIVKDCNEEVYEQNVGDEEVYRHGDGGDPPACHALGVANVLPAGGVDFRREYLTVQHKVRLEEHLRTTQPVNNKKEKDIK